MATIPDGFEVVKPPPAQPDWVPDGFEVAAPNDSGLGGAWNTSKLVGARIAEGAASGLNLPRDMLSEVAGRGAGIVEAVKGDLGDDLSAARADYKMFKEAANRRYMFNVFDSAENMRANARAKMNALEAKYGKAALEGNAENSTRQFLDKNLDIRNTMRMVGVNPAATNQEAAQRLGIPLTPTRALLGDAGKTAGEVASITPGGGLKGLISNLMFGGSLGAAGHIGEGIGGPIGKTAAETAAMIAHPVGAATIKQLGNLAMPLVNRGAVADRALFEMMGNKPLTQGMLPPNPLPGAPLTLGERMGNPGALRAQLALRANPNIQASGLDFEASARDVGNRAANAMFPPVSPQTIGIGLRQGLSDAREAARMATGIGPAKAALANVAMPGNVLKGYVQKYLDTLPLAEQGILQTKGMDVLNKLGTWKAVPFNEVDKAMELMKAEGRRLQYGTNEKRVMGDFFSHMNNLFAYKQPGVQQAFANYAQFKKSFDSAADLKQLLKRNPDGTFKIPPSEIGNALSNLSDEGIRRVASMSPNIRDAGKYWLNARWREVSTKTGDTSYAAARNFFNDNQAFFRAFHTPAEYARAQQILKALEMREAPATVTGIKRFGSPTMEKIDNATFLDGLSGKAVKSIPGGQQVMSFLFKKSSEEIKKKLAEALLNPDSTFARLLTMTPTPSTAGRLKELWTKPILRWGALQGLEQAN